MVINNFGWFFVQCATLFLGFIIVAASSFLIVIFFLMFALIKDLRNNKTYRDYLQQQHFASHLAWECRIYREAANHAKATNSVRRLITDRGGKHLKTAIKKHSSKA